MRDDGTFSSPQGLGITYFLFRTFILSCFAAYALKNGVINFVVLEKI